jgi:hypothetical protein
MMAVLTSEGLEAALLELEPEPKRAIVTDVYRGVTDKGKVK